MSVDDIIKWVPIGVAGFAGGSLLVNAFSFRRTRKLEQVKLVESILKDIRELENEIDQLIKEHANQKEKLEWGRRFFNTLEWLSFLINNNHITDKPLIGYFKPTFKVWHEDWFTYEYLDKELRDDKKEAQEFRKLYDRFRNEENWHDCKCIDCNP